MITLSLLWLCLSLVGEEPAAPADVPLFTSWRSYGLEQGLPSEKVLCVLAGADEVWAGTEAGLVRLRAGRLEAITPEQGLIHPIVTALARDEASGDLWIGTMGGLARWSAGRLDRFDQRDSGLANDVIYAVAVVDGALWAATASGVSVYHPRTREWDIHDHTNTVMHEPWCYGLTASRETVYVAVWGGGVVERDRATGAWRAHRDPDGEMELDLMRDDGLVHDVTSSVAFQDGVLWAATYFGLSRHDGRSWRTYMEHETPLPSNFINFVRARAGWVWIATDSGLAATDGTTWVVHHAARSGAPASLALHDAAGGVRSVPTTGGPIDDYVLGVDVHGDQLWAATARGLSVGTRPRGRDVRAGAEQ